MALAVDRLGLGGSPAGPSAPAMSGEVARATGGVSVSSLERPRLPNHRRLERSASVERRSP